MKQIFNIVLFVFISFIDVSSSAKHSGKQKVQSPEDALNWFNRYGYNPCYKTDAQCSLSMPSMLKDYQKRFHLKQTGLFDEATKKQMNRARCGVRDKPLAESSGSPKLLVYKWLRSSLTYSVHGYPTQISETNTNRIIREAFDAWLAYVPLKIEQVCSTCKADFVLEFAREQHSDTYAFDGSGGTLAHAFFPEDGRVHFDKDEAWTESFNDANTNLYLVAVHEIGHALGLDHVFDEKSIMYPSYQPMPKTNILPSPDRDSVQKIYGSKQSSSEPSTTTRPTTRSTTTQRSFTTTKNSITVPGGRSHPRCRRFLDTAFEHPDGTLHTFNAGVLWRYLPNENKWDERSSSFRQAYPRLPNRLAGGAYDSGSKQIVFFTNTEVYLYDIDHRNRGKLRSEKSLPRNLHKSIVGAIYYKNKIHVITSKTIRLYQLDNGHGQSNERDLSKEFPDFTGTVTTAFSYGDLHHFFTNDRLVYVWSEQLNNWQTFGEPMETSWFACSNAETYAAGRTQVKKPDQHTEHHHHRHRPPNHHHHHHHHD